MEPMSGPRDIEIEHDAECDGDCHHREPECDDGREHKWVGVGGIAENPGVWSLGGTRLAYEHHCSECGWYRRIMSYGSQRDPGQCDRVRYERPEPEGREDYDV